MIDPARDHIARLAAQLPPGRHDWTAFRDLYLQAFPEERRSSDLRARLSGAVQRLAEAGVVRLPSASNRALWDRMGSHHLPHWIQVPRPAKTAPAQHTVSWVDALAWASAERDPKRRHLLEQVNAFLIRCGSCPDVVPEKERSLEIFGDEKRISANLKDGRFLGLVDLAVIGAMRVAAPIPHARPSVAVDGGRPLLVVENEDSYWSLAGWNDTRARYAAVAYGAGAGAHKSLLGLDALCLETGAVSVEYLGDIDPTGFEIPLGVNHARRTDGLPEMKPAVAFYRWLIAHGVRRPDDAKRMTDAVASLIGDVEAWLPADLHGPVKRLFECRERIPQESLGTIALRRDFAA